MEWSIYVLYDPREPDVVRYVGWTENVEKRKRSHVTRARNGRDKTRCGNWKRSLLRDGLEPGFRVVETGSGGDWEEAERRWIAFYRATDAGKLTNLAEGGGGSKGCTWKLTSETKERQRAAALGRTMSEASRLKSSVAKKGKKQSPEHVAKRAAALRGKKRSPEAAARSAAGHVGLKHTEEAKIKIGAATRARLTTRSKQT
jgi:hypothetical protein